jgi:hypothetical protein
LNEDHDDYEMNYAISGVNPKFLNERISEYAIKIVSPSQCNQEWDYSDHGEDWECLVTEK